MDFSEMQFLDEAPDWDQSLMQLALNYVNSLMSESANEDGLVPDIDDEMAMDTEEPVQQSDIFQPNDNSWVLKIESPPAAPVPSLDEQYFSENANDEDTVLVPDVCINTCYDQVQYQYLRHSLLEQMVPNGSTPTLPQIDLPRAPKRKIFDLYPNPCEFYEKPEIRSRIIKRFYFTPPPNSISQEVKESYLKGRMANANLNMRTDFLFGPSGCLPIAEGNIDDCDAISKSLYVDQKYLRTQVNYLNSRLRETKNSKCLDLDEEKYDSLLAEQCPDFDFDCPTNTECLNVTEIFVLDEKIFMKQGGREIIIPRTAVLIPRLSEAEIESILAPPAPNRMPRSPASKYLTNVLNLALFN